MSDKGNCYDNAVAESFFHTLKVKMVHGESFATREDMRQAIFEYIEVDYNRTRRHSSQRLHQPTRLGKQNGRLTRCPLFLGKITLSCH